VTGIGQALLLAACFVLSGGLHAEAPSVATQQQISALLHALGSSQCDFFRNGSWYDSARAESHLARKLAYFERKGLLSTPEAFIDDAASQSSMSGKPYQVRCPGQAAQPSSVWLKRKLEELRRRP
jgi:hypothetical protein